LEPYYANIISYLAKHFKEGELFNIYSVYDKLKIPEDKWFNTTEVLYRRYKCISPKLQIANLKKGCEVTLLPKCNELAKDIAAEDIQKTTQNRKDWKDRNWVVVKMIESAIAKVIPSTLKWILLFLIGTAIWLFCNPKKQQSTHSTNRDGIEDTLNR
jgi:hypothetical protein